MQPIMTLRVPETLQNNLKKIATHEGLTRNALVLQILWDWIKQNQPYFPTSGREVLVLK